MRTFLRACHLVTFGLLFAALFGIPAALHAQVAVAITVAPPALLVYEQLLCPTEGSLWTPGDRAHGPDGYFWTPGLWLCLRILVCFGRPATGDLRAELWLACRLLGTTRWILRRN